MMIGVHNNDGSFTIHGESAGRIFDLAFNADGSLAKSSVAGQFTPSPPPPIATRRGPGTALQGMLGQMGITAEHCQCERYARWMDAIGPAGCRRHYREIVGHLADEAAARSRWLRWLPIKHLLASAMLRLAIWRAARTGAARERLARGQGAV